MSQNKGRQEYVIASTATLNGPFWNTRQFLDQLRFVAAPTYHVAGIRADGDMTDVLNNFDEISRNSKHWKKHKLILGYWDHGNSIPYDDGSNAGEFIRDRYPALLAYHLKGEDTPYAHEARVQVASNLSPQFHQSVSFPPSGLKEHTLYLDRSGSDLRMTEASSPDQMKWSSNESSYLFLPEKLNSIPAQMDPRQNLIFTSEMTQRMPMLGFLSFNLYLKMEGMSGAPLYQADIIVNVAKQGTKGIEPISACLMGKKTLANEAAIDGVIHFRTQPCFIMADFKPGEKVVALITSNNFPTVFRNTGNSPDKYYDSFLDGKIKILHSKNYPSSMSFSTEPQ